jgi:hypothetical protein
MANQILLPQQRENILNLPYEIFPELNREAYADRSCYTKSRNGYAIS